MKVRRSVPVRDPKPGDRKKNDEVSLAWPELVRMGGTNPVAGGSLAALRAKMGMTFRDHARAADLMIANGGDTSLAAERLLDIARTHLTDHNVAFEEVVSHEGHAALRILPEDGASLLAEGTVGIDNLDGFWVLYSPAKLFADGVRGNNWRYQRELFIAHDAINELRLDPITIHEIEHTVLSRAEEKGIPALFTGNVAAVNGGPISAAAPDVAGYSEHLSFQEIPAYAIQCEMLARRLRPQAPLDELANTIGELHAMARWGAALSARVADVASRAVEHLRANPNGVIFERFALTVADHGGPERKAGPRIVWAKVEGLGTAFPQVPLPQANAAYDTFNEIDKLVAFSIEHFERLRDAASELQPTFEAIVEASTDPQLNAPALENLVELTNEMRETSLRHSGEYRAKYQRT